MSNHTAPHLRTDARSGRMIADMLIAAAVLGIFSAVTYGLRPLFILAVSCLTALACEAVCCLIGRRPLRMVLDGTAAITGLTVGLLAVAGLQVAVAAGVEALVRTGGGHGKDAAVINGDKINVIVASEEELVASQVAQINEIVYEATGILPVNVKIMRK